MENPSLAMSSPDREWIIENVNLVFHCAATIKFNETIELATKINIEGTERLLELAAEMKHLEVKKIPSKNPTDLCPFLHQI